MGERVKRWLRPLDLLFEYLGLASLMAMILIITGQVFTRQVLNASLFWSGETSLILMVWVGFIGIAIGFRERSHIAIEILVQRLPETAQEVVGFIIHALIFAFGLYLLIYGGSFTVETSQATLPSTGLPRSVLYVMMPVAGFMICIYTALQAFGVQTERYEEQDPGEPEAGDEGSDASTR